VIRLPRRRTPPQTAPGPRDAPIPLTSATDGRTHLISTAELDRTIAEQRSRYRTLCGSDVLAAALAAPPGPLCRDCHAPQGGPATVQPGASYPPRPAKLYAAAGRAEIPTI
jgi:hypothetical protein